MSEMLKKYGEVVGFHAMDSLMVIADMLRGKKIVHVNSTKEGGGVAEILSSMVPLSKELGLDVSWEVIEGNPDFFACTKTLHNSLQGMPGGCRNNRSKRTSRQTVQTRRSCGGVVEDADYVFIHDPQPAPLLGYFPKRGKVDLALPYRRQLAEPLGLAVCQEARGGVRRVDLLASRFRPDAPAPPVSDHAEHRPPERKEYRAAEKRGCEDLRGTRYPYG